jgi:hypothetical protein
MFWYGHTIVRHANIGTYNLVIVAVDYYIHVQTVPKVYT